MKPKVKKTQITNIKDLKEGDVLLTISPLSMERYPNMPKCNYMRIEVVSTVEKRTFNNGTSKWVYDTVKHYKLDSDNGDHEIVIEALKKHEVLPTGKFGCNHTINENNIVYRLDNIKNKKMPVSDLPNLKGNPGYDLMM